MGLTIPHHGVVDGCCRWAPPGRGADLSGYRADRHGRPAGGLRAGQLHCRKVVLRVDDGCGEPGAHFGRRVVLHGHAHTQFRHAGRPARHAAHSRRTRVEGRFTGRGDARLPAPYRAALCPRRVDLQRNLYPLRNRSGRRSRRGHPSASNTTSSIIQPPIFPSARWPTSRR